jgi:hypothetical protein
MISDSRRIAHLAFSHIEDVAGTQLRRLCFEGRSPCGNMVKHAIDLTPAESVDLVELLFKDAQKVAEKERQATAYLVPVDERKAS